MATNRNAGRSPELYEGGVPSKKGNRKNYVRTFLRHQVLSHLEIMIPFSSGNRRGSDLELLVTMNLSLGERNDLTMLSI
jgi:hypothetical protein